MQFFKNTKRAFIHERDVPVLDTGYSKRNIHNVSEAWTFIVTAAVLGIFFLTSYNLRENLPKALSSVDLLTTENTFISERAWKDLKIITSFGPRPAGSYSNEVLAVDFLKREIGHIKQTANKNQRIEIDLQVVSGAFWNGFNRYPMTSVYRKVQNVVVKLHGKPNMNGQSNNNSLLFNCHFDSVAGSQGASDDAANCVVMLEVLRVLSRSQERNEHSIIFLFNGAEETGLQASHGFITQHKWANQIKAFINLESVGSAGREMLFQSTAKSSCLLEIYGQAAMYPSAQVAAEEIFQSGLIPSDTDLRIFRDFGNVSGIDFAYYLNGHRYHTKFDHIKFMTKESLQHTGTNMLNLAKSIANSDCMINLNESVHVPQIFFDVFGLKFVNYTASSGSIINLTVAFCGVMFPLLMILKATRGLHKKYVYSEIFLGFLVKIVSIFVAGIAVQVVAFDLDSNGKSMTWYNHPNICLATYCLFTVLFQCLLEDKFQRSSHTPLSLALQVQGRLIGVCLFWSAILCALTLLGIRTAYVVLVPLIVVLICHVTVGVLSYQNTRRKWLYVHLIGQAFVVAWCSCFYSMILDVFMATAGRGGPNRNPDIIVGVICCALTFFATSFLTSLLALCKTSKRFAISLIVIYAITRYYLIACTNYGFPYGDETDDMPRIQRHHITHTMRTLYDKDGSIRYTDSGFWMLEFDRNAHKTIESLTVPEKPVPQDKNILCKSEVLCGLPLYSSRQLMASGFWIPGPTPNIREVAHLSLLNHQKLSDHEHRMNFVITGSHQLSLQIRLKDSVTLEGWSFLPIVPTKMVYNNQTAYFVMITRGLEEELFNFSLDLKVSGKENKRSLVDITLVTLHMEYHKDHTTEFSKLLSRLPSWAYAIPTVAALKSWTF